MNRMILVSNRLPVTTSVLRGQLVLTRSSGGLASALRPVHVGDEGIWIGWPGELPPLSDLHTRQLEWQLAAHRAVPVMLSAEEFHDFYEEVANGVLWPVAHCLLSQLPLELKGWDTYVKVNERFADAVVAQYRPGDAIWVHDYHLMLLPALLRARLPCASVGYFHHIPFPPHEVFRRLPWYEELLRGLLGADLVGFQTAIDAANYEQALREDLNVRARDGEADLGFRAVRIGHFPIGIDVDEWEQRAAAAETAEGCRGDVRDGDRMRVVLGVDRMDYTKGIPRRLLAFERLLEREPALRGRVRLVQVTVPSRDGVAAYDGLKRQVDELVGRINGRFGTPEQMPVHRVHGHLTPAELASLYRSADVLLATPLRDGMNLVAKEFVAARIDEDGVLVLSEFAGAAQQLIGALLVNPYDVDGVARTIERALAMPSREREGRMAALRTEVRRHDVHAWSEEFRDTLDRAGRRTPLAARE